MLTILKNRAILSADSNLEKEEINMLGLPKLSSKQKDDNENGAVLLWYLASLVDVFFVFNKNYPILFAIMAMAANIGIANLCLKICKPVMLVQRLGVSICCAAAYISPWAFARGIEAHSENDRALYVILFIGSFLIIKWVMTYFIPPYPDEEKLC